MTTKLKRRCAGSYFNDTHKVFSVVVGTRKEWRVERASGVFVTQVGSFKLAKHACEMDALGNPSLPKALEVLKATGKELSI